MVDVVVVTPWFPHGDHPAHGAFVRDSVRALESVGARPEIVHLRAVPGDMGAPSSVHSVSPGVRRIDVPTPGRSSKLVVAALQEAALRAHALDLLSAAQAVHAHVGLPTGIAVSELLDKISAKARLVVSEHATYLRDELRVRAVRDRYQAMLQRGGTVLCVTEHQARGLRSMIPEQRSRIGVCPNPVRADLLPLLGSDRQELDRWLYIGSLTERKGVGHLVAAFTQWHRERPWATLTVVGTGALESTVRTAAQSTSLGSRVHMLGSVEPSKVGEVLAEHDVLVHLSSYETFGMTAVEAAITGMPVVVASSEGPQETLRGQITGGSVALVSRRPRPADVCAAVRALENAVFDRRRQRSDLLAHFSPQVVGSRLVDALTCARVPARTVDLVIVDLGRGSGPELSGLVDDATSADLNVTLISDRVDQNELGGGVHVHSVPRPRKYLTAGLRRVYALAERLLDPSTYTASRAQMAMWIRVSRALTSAEALFAHRAESARQRRTVADASRQIEGCDADALTLLSRSKRVAVIDPRMAEALAPWLHSDHLMLTQPSLQALRSLQVDGF